MSFNTPSDLKGKYRFLGEQYTDSDIQNELDAAHRRLKTDVGKKFIERDRAEIDDQEDFVFSFKELESFDEVKFANESDYIDASNYSVDLKTGTLTFDTEFAEDNISIGKELIYKYVPTIFKDLEKWLAIKSIVLTSSLQNRNNESQINLEQVNSQIKSLKQEINEKAGNTKILDHRPRFPTRTL